MSSLHNSPMIVGLTGGIGAGKSTIAKMFLALGVPVYNADQAAKRLMNQDQALRLELSRILGPNTYHKGLLNRPWVAEQLFANPELLDRWNACVHPKVAEDFIQWSVNQTGPYVIKEAAILFETNGQKNCDATVLITAPKALRRQRVMDRDQLSQQEVDNRMANQWSDQQKIKLADFVIENIVLAVSEQRVVELHRALSAQFK